MIGLECFDVDEYLFSVTGSSTVRGITPRGIPAPRLGRGWLGGLVVLCLLAGLVRPAWATTEVLDLRLDRDGTAVRLVLTVSQAPEFTIFQLEGPDRLVVDIDQGRWSGGETALPASPGPVQDVRRGQFTPDILRIVLDLDRPVAVDDVLVLPPTPTSGYRLALTVSPIGTPSNAASTGPTPPPAAVQPVPETVLVAWGGAIPLPRRLPAFRTEPRPVVVIDPGHGGRDPGAIGVDGVFEKSIVLAVAQRLREMLDAGGRYRVLMTREDDRFVTLDDRVALARDARADLFVSIHADSIDDPGLRGASVYTLSQRASDRQAARLARRENQALLFGAVTDGSTDDQTASILIDLAQRHTNNQSTRLAETLVEELAHSTTLLGQPHRQAGFVVLTAPDVPSALVELGFLSNQADGRQLAREEHQERLAEALARAVVRFVEASGPGAMLAEGGASGRVPAAPDGS